MDSQARIVACLQIAIEEVGLELRSEAQLRDIIGLGLREALQVLYPQGNESDNQALISAYRHQFVNVNEIPTPLFEGARALLQRLNDDGHFVAVATGKGRQGLNKVLQETQLGQYIHYSRCSDETASKPHPQMLLEIIDWLGVEKHQTLMVGDTEYDLQMAQNAEVSSLAVSHGVHEVPRLLACKPLACVDNLGEMADWLEKYFLQAA